MWRAGGGSFGGGAPIPTGTNDYPFSLTYDPNGAGGRGTVTATIGSYSSVMTLDSGHKADGATFNRFGILNVMKSADDPGQLWLDDVTINGEAHPFDSNPGWDQRNNRRTYTTSNVRPRFDFGYSRFSNFAGGERGGKLVVLQAYELPDHPDQFDAVIQAGKNSPHRTLTRKVLDDI